MKLPRFFIAGIRAVKAEETMDGGLAIWAYEPSTDTFVPAIELLDRIFRATSDVDEITESEFNKAIEKLKRGEELG